MVNCIRYMYSIRIFILSYTNRTLRVLICLINLRVRHTLDNVPIRMSHRRPHTNELNKEIRSVQGEALLYTSPLPASLVLMEVNSRSNVEHLIPLFLTSNWIELPNNFRKKLNKSKENCKVRLIRPRSPTFFYGKNN